MPFRCPQRKVRKIEALSTLARMYGMGATDSPFRRGQVAGGHGGGEKLSALQLNGSTLIYLLKIEW